MKCSTRFISICVEFTSPAVSRSDLHLRHLTKLLQVAVRSFSSKYDYYLTLTVSTNRNLRITKVHIHALLFSIFVACLPKKKSPYIIIYMSWRFLLYLVNREKLICSRFYDCAQRNTSEMRFRLFTSVFELVNCLLTVTCGGYKTRGCEK